MLKRSFLQFTALITGTFNEKSPSEFAMKAETIVKCKKNYILMCKNFFA